MAKERTRPDLTGDERTQLLGWLELQRRVLHHKCDGLILRELVDRDRGYYDTGQV